ncbi:alpha/beta fold hydrolase [Sphingobacterium sp. SYP-B4668]|uniref:alpha/beta fold hydrolase n=1 Tax=Sphingobacterium sp. SYP-B4668 TaxID=2996035 RepID=UPI0022DE3346|nr:alpha/beta hydrolase [Sphingobacterium sp. SYP-B4668]
MEAKTVNKSPIISPLGIEVAPGVSIDYSDTGSGLPILLIHGWPLNKQMFEYQAQYLNKQGYRVITVSLRGFGKSSKPYGNYNYDQFAEDLHLVIESLGLQNIVLGGFSMGAAVAIKYIAKYGDSNIYKLWMIGAAVPLYTKRDDYTYAGPTVQDVDALLVQLNRNRPSVIQSVGLALGAKDSLIIKEYLSWIFSMGIEASLYATEQSLIALRDTDLRDEIAKVQIPVTIFHGKKDQICPYLLAEQMQQTFSKSTLIPFENSGHALLWEEMDRFHEELLISLKS